MGKIAALGEVLFDSFEGKEIIGGAPFNFIYHINALNNIHNLGFSPFLISKVGKDERGKKVLSFFSEHQLENKYLQVAPEISTGVVEVTVNSLGIPEYEIVENAAYDYIEFDGATRELIMKDVSLFYFGTLFQRTASNRLTLSNCLPDETIHEKKVFFDINLRQNYYSWEIIDNSLLYADYLKLNLDEIEVLKYKFFPDKKSLTYEEFIHFLIKEYILSALILTKGDKGAEIFDNNENRWNHKGKSCPDIKDSVGAGDGFSAIFCLGILLRWPMNMILNRAIDFSCEICRIEGAIPKELTWYNQFKVWF